MSNMVFSKTRAIFHLHNSLLESTDTQQPLCCHGVGQEFGDSWPRQLLPDVYFH